MSWGAAGQVHSESTTESSPRWSWLRAARLSSWALIASLCIIASTGQASAASSGSRPLVDAPPQLLGQAAAPCVLYSCAGNPGPHLNWINTVGQLPVEYCSVFNCRPLDLIPDHGFDDNLFPFDPDWAFFAETHHAPDANMLCHQFEGSAPYLGSPPCSSQHVTTDGPGTGTLASRACPLGRAAINPPSLFPVPSFHGHLNWEPATYEGLLTWGEHSPPGTDDDYSLELQTPNGSGATTGNGGGQVHLEFDSDETIDQFDGNPWWNQLHQAVRATDFAQTFDLPGNFAGQLINGHLAVVTGLVGLDTAHTPATESHPVFIMAIQTNRKAALTGGVDRWAFFVRNWGNEGFCASHQHVLPVGPLTIRIPWLTRTLGMGAEARTESASQVTVTGQNIWDQNITGDDTILGTVLPGEGVVLKFNLPTPDQALFKPMYWGTVDLKWTFGPSNQPPASNPGLPQDNAPAAALAVTPKADDSENADIEALVAQLWRGLPDKIRTTALAMLPHERMGSRHTRRTSVVMAAPPTVPFRSVGSFLIPVTDPFTLALGRTEYRSLCAAFGGHMPKLGVPGTHRRVQIGCRAAARK